MNVIDSQHLRVFCTLARHLNMSRTAAELNLTPSGISHCLKALETDLGCRLFERNSRKFSLTQAGREFRKEAEAIMVGMASARAKLQAWVDWRKGHLRVISSATACQHILPVALREFRESFPEFTVQVLPASGAQAVQAIADEAADLALVVEPTVKTGCAFVAAAEDELQYVVHPLHPWAVKGRVARDEVAAQNYIFPQRSSETFTLVQEHFRRLDLRARSAIEVGDDEAIKQYVALDLGVGLLPRWLIHRELQAGELAAFSVGRIRLRRRWGLLHPDHHKLNFAESLFVELCRNVARKLMDEQPH